jgi:hypothetical protein
MPQVEFIDNNIQVAKSFRPLPADEMRRLGDQLSGQFKASIDRYFNDHIDA